MQKRFNTLLAPENRGGNLRPVSGASVTVTDPNGALATIYSDNGVTEAANPLTSSATGEYEYYAADGRYTETIVKAGRDTVTIRDILLEDPADSPSPTSADIASTADSKGAGLVGFLYSAVYAAGTLGKWLQDLATSVGSSFIGHGTGTVAEKLDALELGAAGMSWDTATFPLYAAHRGMEMSFPENTLIAYQEAIKAGAGAVEMDAYVMADGNLVAIHDSTTGRTCRAADGTAIDLTVESIKAQDLYGLDASIKHSTSHGFYGSDFEYNSPPLVRDVLATIKGKAIIMIEAKASTLAKAIECGEAIAALVEQLSLQPAVVIQCTYDLLANGADLRGIKAAYITNSATALSSAALDALVASGYYMLVQNKSALDSTYKTLVTSKGLKIATYTYSQPDELTTIPDVILATDTTIVAGLRLAGSRDYLMRKYPGPGYIREGFGGSSGTAPLSYPVIRTIGTRRAIGWDSAHSSAAGINRFVVGCIDPDPNNDGQYTLDFDMIWTAIGATTNNHSCIMIELDKAGTLSEGAASSVNKRGYFIGFRANGGAALYRMSGDTPTATSLATATGLPSPPVVNTAYPCRIVVNSSGITVTFDVGGLNITMTTTDTTHRNGKYIQFERRGHGFMIANLRAS